MIEVHEFGGDGPHVLLLHGGGGNALHWTEFAAHMTGFRLVAVDLPSHGGSGDSSWAWDDVLDELAEAGLGNPAVVGHSLGGIAAIRWGKRHPDCPAVVNLDGNGWPSTYPGMTSDEVDAARSTLNAAFRAQSDALARPLSPDEAEALVAQQPALRHNLVGRDGKYFLRPERPALDTIRELIARESTTDLYEGLRCPALVVVATRLFPAQEPFARLLTAQQRGVVQDLAGRDVVEFDGSHGMLFEKPREVAALIAGFLRGCFHS